MKNLRKLSSLLLVISMVLIMPSNVFAKTIEKSGETSTIPVEGAVTPVTFTVTVPTSLSFSINPNNAEQVTTVSAPIENKTSLAVDVNFLGFKSTASTNTKVVAPNTYTDEQWAKLGKSDTESKIALGLKEGENTYWAETETADIPNTNIGSIHLDAMGNASSTKSIEITAKTGKAWGTVKTLDYSMYLSIMLSDIQEPVVPVEPVKNYVMATDEDFSKGSGYGQFRYIGKGEYVQIPDVIQGMDIYDYYEMFKGYSGQQLKGVKSTNPKIMDTRDMFANCNLKSLRLDELHTEKVRDMSAMFSNSKIQSLDLSNFNTSSAKNMSRMFEGCTAENLCLSSFDTQNVTDMELMFHMSSVKDLDISNFNTEKVTKMNSMFNACKAVSYNLNNFSIKSVDSFADMQYLFGVTSAKTIDLSSIDLSRFNTYSLFDKTGAVTLIYVRSQLELDRLNADATKPLGCVVKIKSA